MNEKVTSHAFLLLPEGRFDVGQSYNWEEYIEDGDNSPMEQLLIPQRMGRGGLFVDVGLPISRSACRI